MKGEFSRDSFDRLQHFRRVLMQQGKVQLDADWNEQVSILLHYIQTLATDIIGPYAGPVSGCGFMIEAKGKDFQIGPGRYYVDGVLCENEKAIKYTDQLHQPRIPTRDTDYIVYLDVWERHITKLEDDGIPEKALDGPDTATRAKTVWQVKVKELTPPYAFSYCAGGAELLDNEIAISKACLRARAKGDPQQVEPCLVEPEARYRGTENQLYRVEVHDGGRVTDRPTFKWSRENGSVAFPIKGIKSDGTDTFTVDLENLGRDERFGLAVNDWVEIENDDSVLNNMANPLLQVQKVDRFEMTVTLKTKPGVSFNLGDATHALLRRWDQKKGVSDMGVVAITESESNPPVGWLELEDGIKIQFKTDGTYRTGDYWLIPARTTSGDVEWPGEELQGEPTPKFLPPRGVMHHLAPLAIISVSKETVKLVHDCRCTFKPLSYSCAYSYYGRLGIGVDLLCPE